MLQEKGRISLQTLKRLPNYYNYLKGLSARGEAHVAAPEIASAMALNDVQVRKDLASVSSCPGTPRRGFSVEALLRDIGTCLGYNNLEDAVLVGAGKLGRALLGYEAFEQHGISIVAAFDSDPRAVAESDKIFEMDKLASLCERLHVHIGIITVPADQAQQVCDLLVQSGVTAIWNFASVHLSAPSHVLVQNENLAASLALLARQLEQTNGGGAAT